MRTLRVIAVKLTEDIPSTKVAYETPDGKLYIRTGQDAYKVGVPVQGGETTLLSQWAFRKVVNPPEFRDGDEIYRNINRFQLKNNGLVQYY